MKYGYLQIGWWLEKYKPWYILPTIVWHPACGIYFRWLKIEISLTGGL